jgi:hypothetical protein
MAETDNNAVKSLRGRQIGTIGTAARADRPATPVAAQPTVGG